MSFADFEDQMIKENRKLKVLFVASFFISLIIMGLLIAQKTYFIYRGGEIFEERLLSARVCEEGLKSILKGEPNSHFVTSGVIKLLDKVDFQMPIDRILKLQSLELGACKVVLESAGELLAFKITLKESALYPFEYKLNQIDELSTKEMSNDLSYHR